MGVHEGKRIFVPYAAPGDVLDVEVTSDHGSWAEAAIASIVSPAPCRVRPCCPAFGMCGGCQWQHISYEAQLEWKRRILIEALGRIGRVYDPQVSDTLPSPKQWHYRNRIQLHVDSEGRVGFYRPGSREVVEFDECFIADARINRKLSESRVEVSRRDRGIALRSDDGVGFSQVNSEQNERLKGVIVEWLEDLPHRTVLEMYAGDGNFTFAIAKVAGRVVASDVDGRAIGMARRRRLSVGAQNVGFVCAPAGRLSAGELFRRASPQLRQWRSKRHGPEYCDAVFLDPPRKGCAEAVEMVAAARPESILYVSCDPATLARDVRSFAGHGYRFVKALPVDMFPQTYHVESLALLEKTE